MHSARLFIACLGLAALRLCGGEAPAAARPFAALEQRHGGRLGVAALDTVTGRRLGYREDERFALCSTFKLALVACVLSRVDAGTERLDLPVACVAADLVIHSPVVEKRLAAGSITVGDLCAAAMQQGDNAAANLLLQRIGGPATVTSFFRSLGDEASRLDRTEPTMNEYTPGDARDTTTPAAMLGDLRTLLCGDRLSPASRGRLQQLMRECTTGSHRLRAGVPAGWTAGNRSGSGPKGETNDLAILVPPGRAPILVAAYYSESPATSEAKEAVLAEVARIVSAAFVPTE